MINYLEKVLCIEILEKVARFQRYLKSEPDASRSKSLEVINIFLRALDSILDETEIVVSRLAKEVVLSEWERIAIQRRLSDIFKSVDRLHLQLQNIYGLWVRPETHVFLRNVLEFIPQERQPSKVNVILSNMYSFLETDLSSYMEDVLSPADINIDSLVYSPAIFLPKIEIDNPLNWAILVHECGHIDYQDISEPLENNSDLVPSHFDTKSKSILKKWIQEVYCDLFATKILGPAYLASFATFAIVTAGAGGSEIAYETHPPDVVRIAIIQEVLQKSNIRVNIPEVVDKCTDMSYLFFTLLEERSKLDRLHIHSSIEQKLPKIAIGEFVDIICEEVNRIISLKQELTIKDFARIDSLEKRLSKGIYIGSYRESQFNETLITKIQTEKNSCDLNVIKNSVTESRVLLWEIINAGWLHKIKELYPRAFSLFFGTNDGQIKDKIVAWGKEMEDTDRLLLKSIEAAEIQKLLEEP